MEQPVIIFGARGLGKIALEIFQGNQVVVYGFLDDDSALHGTTIDEIPVLGATEDQGYLKLIGKKCQAFVAEDDQKLKEDLVSMLNSNRKVMPVNGIHQNAYLSSSVGIGHGNLIQAGAVLNPQTSIGNHNIVQANCTLDYGVQIQDFVNLGAGCCIGADVKIASGVFVGAGATIVSGVTIGKYARIGAGSVVVSDIDQMETVFGNPAQKVNQN
jgi:sugar O-acyltransferase (sialic acid O-acetyltransferase NeuD family)